MVTQHSDVASDGRLSLLQERAGAIIAITARDGGVRQDPVSNKTHEKLGDASESIRGARDDAE